MSFVCLRLSNCYTSIAGIDVTRSTPPSNGHVIHRLERQPLYRKKKGGYGIGGGAISQHQQDWSTSSDDNVSAYDLAMTYIEFLKLRPVIMYPQIICSGCLVFMGITIAKTLSQPGAFGDLLRYRSGRFSDFYTLIGVWCVLKVFYHVARLVWQRVVSNDTVFRNAGTWAVVTGCTSGLGKQYALQLAAKGMNMILISRNQESLNDLAEEISNKYNVDIMTHAADFKADDDIYEEIADRFADLDIGVLVNNVGTTHDPNLYQDIDINTIMDIIKVNMKSLAEMCSIFLPGMSQRKRGIVINLASGLGTTPSPLVATYGSSKRYVDMLSRVLDQEYNHRGMIIQSVTPYFISTNMTKNVEEGPLIPDPATFVRHQLTTVGRDNVTYGYWPHTLQGWIVKKLPGFINKQLFYLLKRNSDKLAENKLLNGKH